MMSEKTSSTDETISMSDPSFANPAVRWVISSMFLPALKIFGEILLLMLWVPLAILRILREPIIFAAICVLVLSWTCIGLISLTAYITGYDRASLALYFAISPLSYFYVPIPAIIDLPAAANLQTLHESLRALNSVVTTLQDGVTILQDGVTILQDGVNAHDTRCIQDDEIRSDVGVPVERPDYALYTTGGRVLKTLTSPSNVDQSQDERSWRIAKPTESLFPWPSGAAMAIHYETQPGYCWPLKGTHGTLGVRLSRRVFIEEIAIDNVPAQLAWDRSSTPRRMELWGQVDGADDLKIAEAWEVRHAAAAGASLSSGQSVSEHHRLFNTGNFVRLSSFEFDLSSPANVQVFPVNSHVQDLPIRFDTVVLVILDNWGKEDYTCLYRLRVYGNLGLSLVAIQSVRRLTIFK